LDYQEVYYIGIPRVKQRDEFDDERGYYKVTSGDHIAYRYQVMDTLGQGSFGQVLKVFDHKTKAPLALKIIRNKNKFLRQAAVEARILTHLARVDVNDEYNVVHMKECFQFRKHTCFTFELLSYNLYEFLKFNKFQGLSLELIRRLAGQILIALKMLSECNIIHCDLKPENILLKHPKKSAIKVIDFGSSCYTTERLYKYIQSRYYRAPEVILGMPYSPAIDVWSFGCICAELYTGRPLFPGTTECDQLHCIMEVKGVPPSEILEQASRKMLFFDEMGSPRASRKGKSRQLGSKSLGDILKGADSRFVEFIDSKL
jgi:serine/threonine protein kinase